METHRIELYDDAVLARLRRKIKYGSAALLALSAGALAACLVLIALTGTENASRMELAAIAVSTVAGWIVIYGSIFVVGDARRELAHARMLHSEPRQRVQGAVTVTKERVVIRRSITVRRVEVRDGGQCHRLLVCQSRAAALTGADCAAVYTAHGYIAAYEVKP